MTRQPQKPGFSPALPHTDLSLNGRATHERGFVGCKNPVLTEHGVVSCGKCSWCSRLYFRRWVGRIAAEGVTARHCLFVTLTYDQEHLEEGFSLPNDHPKRFLQAVRRKHKCRAVMAGETGSKTARPHWHGLLFFPGSIPEIPHRFSDRYPFWHKGNSQWEVPRSRANAAAYVLKYMLKDSSSKVILGNALGRDYLLNYAAMIARNRRSLGKPQGIFYTVPGSRQRQGPLWKYHLKPNHHYAKRMAQEYCKTWAETWGTEPDLDQFRSINFDWD